MKHELNPQRAASKPFGVPAAPPPALEQRLAARPELLAALQALVDTLEQSHTRDCDAHTAEDCLVDTLRKLGRTTLSQWAQEAHARCQAAVPTQYPEASQHGKKKRLNWLTTLGWISVEETQWRLGRRGKLLRPFCAAADLQPRGTSRRMQRALVDFGAEKAFGPAAQRVQEHYGVDVSAGRVRRHTLAHGAQLGAQPVPPPKTAAATLVTQMDGSLIPIVTPDPERADQRQGKTLSWREARLGLARAKDSATPVYGATLGSAGIAGQVWRQTAVAAGLGADTHVHGVGDGSDWIVAQFREQFGPQGSSLLDFWHVSDYLAGAATAIAPAQAIGWRHDQQGRLLTNDRASVLQALEAHLEPEGQAETPVRTAHRYLSERTDQLDYAGARAAGLPIGSGEVEGGHRHVIQERLKLTGCWWLEPHAEAMLGLRTARANGLWAAYWRSLENQKN
jgi:hypothetical protein